MKPEILATPMCPMHNKALASYKDVQGLWIVLCYHPGCTKAGYGWDAADAYLDFHRANQIKVANETHG
jgi:hypothetical protein